MTPCGTLFAVTVFGLGFEKEKDMFKIEALIRPQKLEDVKDHLGKSGIHSLTITETTDFKENRGDHAATYRGAGVSHDTVRMLLLRFFVPEDTVDDIVETLLGAAMTGSGRDGEIAVTKLHRLVDITTGEAITKMPD